MESLQDARVTNMQLLEKIKNLQISEVKSGRNIHFIISGMLALFFVPYLLYLLYTVFIAKAAPASVTHDTQAEFQAGTENRLKTTADPDHAVQITYQELPADINTVGLWHMNNNWNDSSGNGNNGTATGATFITNNAKLGGYSGSFDGSDDNVSTPLTNISNTFTIEMWVYPTTTHEIDAEATSGATGTSGQKYAWWNGGDSGSTNAGALISVGTNGISVYEHCSGYMPPLAVYSGNVTGWNHIAVVYNNKQPSIYLNGVLVRTGLTSPKSNVYPYATGGWSETNIFRFGGGAYGYFPGYIDEARISSVARSPEEIKADAQKRPYGVYTSPVIDLGSHPTSLNSINWVDSITPPTLPSGWTRVKPVLIDNTQNPSALTNYQAKVLVDYDSNMQSDFDDLIFTNSSGANLDYWIESKSDGVEATIWVEVDSISSNDLKTIFMFYGNSGASAASNGDNTFNFFDDFNTWNVDKWGSQPSVATINGGIVTITGTGSEQGIISIPTFAQGTAIRSRTSLFQLSGSYCGNNVGFINSIAGSTEMAVARRAVDYTVYYYDSVAAGALTRITTSLTADASYRIFDIMRRSGANEFAIDGGYKKTVTTNVSTASLPVCMNGYALFIQKTDWILVRQYTAIEPTTSVGASVEFQTRTSADNSTWEAWKPTTNETPIASMDSDASNWSSQPTANFTQSWKKRDNTIPTPSNTTGTNGRIPLGTSGGDTTNLHAPAVIKDGDTYKMWYSGSDGPNWRIYYATSPDGLTWTKYDNSISAASNTTGTNGRIPLGTSGGDLYGAISPSVIKDDLTYKMWYGGAGGDSWRIYYATSADGLTWTKYDNTVPANSNTTGTNGRIPLGTSGGDTSGVFSPAVIKDGSTYKMWYHGSDDFNWRIYYATSPDGLTWTKYDNSIPAVSNITGTNGRIPLGTSGSGDTINVYYPGVIKDGSLYKMWYSGHSGSNTRDYYAYSSDGLTWTKYDNSTPSNSDGSSTNGRIPLGTTGKGDVGNTYTPTAVIKDGNTYKIWYTGYNANWIIYNATMDLMTLPLAKADESTIKMEGTGSMKTIIGQPQVDANTVGLWHMEETSGTGAYIKDSASTNHGTPTGTSVTNGFFGKARSFNGSSDYISVGDSASFDLGTQNTVSAWIRLDTVTTDQSIIAHDDGGGTTNKWMFRYRGTTNELNVALGDGSSNANVSVPFTATANTWYYVAFVKNSSTYSFYVNGNFIGSQANSLNPNASTNLEIGRGEGAFYFDGLIDEVRISNVARTAEEIAEAYRAGRDYRVEKTLSSTDLSGKNKIPFYVASDRPGTNLEAYIGETTNSVYGADSNTVGLWHMDENTNPEAEPTANTQVLYHLNETSGISIADASGNGKTGTANNSPSISSGKWGNGRSFTAASTQSITFADTNLGTDHTVEAWVQFPLAASAAYRTLFANNGGTYHYILVDTTGLLGVFNAGWFSCSYDVDNISSGWHHLAAVATGSTTVFYLDGASLCTSSTKISGQNIGAVGNASTSGGQGWGGAIDEVRISSRALTPSEFYKKKIIKDSTSYGNHGDNFGSTLTQGKIGKGRYFNGTSDYITVADSGSLDFGTGSFTVMGWLKTPSGTVLSDNCLVFKSTSGGYSLCLENDGYVFFKIGTQIISNQSGYGSTVYNGSQLDDGVWHHVAAVRNGTDHRIYIDGSLAAQETAAAQSATNASNINIGRNYDALRYAIGTLDHIEISNTARTATEIQQVYQYGLRTHPITTDFVTNPQATYASGTSITINNPWGTTNLTDTLSVGETMIIRENENGTEYISQAGVASIVNTSSTYGTVTLSAAFSSIPPSGFTTNARVFKWQREYWDINDISEADRNAITKMGIRVMDASQGFTFWLDDIRSAGPYLTDPSATENITSTTQRYMQYRFIESSNDNVITPEVTSVTIQYNEGYFPTASVSNLSGQGNVYAGKTLDISARYSDEDGAGDLNQLYLRIQNPGGTDIEYYGEEGGDASGLAPTAVSGSDYVTAITYDRDSGNPTANDITVTWHITFDWDWVENTNVEYGVRVLDDDLNDSGWDYTDSDYRYENDLDFTGTITVSGSVNGSLSSGDWVQASESINWTGLAVVYEGETTVYPQDSDFDVRVSDDDTGTWDDLISSGEAINIDSTADAVYEDEDIHNIDIINIPSGGSDVSSQTFTLRVDDSVPIIDTLTSSTHPIQSNWYNNNTPAFSWTTSDGESGVEATWRLIDQTATHDAAYVISNGTADIEDGNWTSGALADGTWYFHLAVRNEANYTAYDNFTVNIDTADPAIDTLTSSSHPTESSWYTDDTPGFEWTTGDSGSGVEATWRLIDQTASHDAVYVITNGTEDIEDGNWTSGELTNGTWYFHLAVRDNVNRTSYDSFTVNVDDSAPVIDTLTSSSHPNQSNWYNNNTPAFGWTTSDGESGVESTWRLIDQTATHDANYVITNGTIDTEDGNLTSGALAEGTWYFHLAVRNNTALTAYSSFTVNIDTADPSIDTLTSSTNPNQVNWYSDDTPTVSWATSDSGSGVEQVWRLVDQTATHNAVYVIANGTGDNEDDSWTSGELANGVWYFHLAVRDNASKTGYGNYTLKIDDSVPNIVDVTGNYEGVWQNSNSGPVISWTDPNSSSDDTFYITNDGSIPNATNYQYSTTTATYDLPEQGQGEKTIRVRPRNGAGTYGNTHNFIIRYDSIAPTNVSNLTATALSTSSIKLDWNNPGSDFDHVLIVRKQSGIPTSPSDGTSIYSGTAQTYTDSGLSAGTKYYYAVFAYDPAGNNSSGAAVSKTTLSVITPPPDKEVEETLIEELTETGEDTEEIEQEDLEIEIRNIIFVIDGVEIEIEESTDLHAFSDSQVEAKVPIELIVDGKEGLDISQVILIIGDNVYIMQLDEQGEYYTAKFKAPDLKGEYDIFVIVTFSDESGKKINLKLTIDPYGYVYSIKDGNEVRIRGAVVSLYKDDNGESKLWDTNTEQYSNPQFTNEQGEYSFVVEAGKYKLRAEAEDYNYRETEWFEVTTRTIEINIELKKLTVFDNVVDFIEENPDVATATTGGAIATTSIASFSYLLLFLRGDLFNVHVLADAILISLGIRKKKAWGVIIDNNTGKPINFAVIRVFDEKGKQIDVKVTDSAGRYALILDKGTYKLDFSHSEYKSRSISLDIKEEKAVRVMQDIKLESTVAKSALLYNTRKFGADTLKVITKTLIFLAFILGIINVIINPNIINILLGAISFVIVCISIWSLLIHTKSWGAVLNSQTKDMVRFAYVRLFNYENQELEDIQITDKKGRFGFIAEPGIYGVLVTAQGFKYPSKCQKRVLKGKLKENLLEVNIKKGESVSMDLLVDPGEGKGAIYGKDTQLASPFSG